eukprot:3340412-Ditylum_brightwellii.AAC.1
MDEDTFFSCQSNHFDLISAIDQLIINSPIEWYWHHVYGHQDDDMGPLNQWESLNVEMDQAAKTRRVDDEQANTPEQHEID